MIMIYDRMISITVDKSVILIGYRRERWQKNG